MCQELNGSHCEDIVLHECENRNESNTDETYYTDSPCLGNKVKNLVLGNIIVNNLASDQSNQIIQILPNNEESIELELFNNSLATPIVQNLVQISEQNVGKIITWNKNVLPQNYKIISAEDAVDDAVIRIIGSPVSNTMRFVDVGRINIDDKASKNVEIFEENDETLEEEEDVECGNSDDESRYQCKHCGRTFKYKTSICRHIRSHCKELGFSEETYECNVCPKTFQQKSNLLRHMKIHTGERK